MSDKNYVSFAGNDKGDIYYQAADGSTTLLFAAGDYSKDRSFHIGDLKAPDGSYSDTLKLSGLLDFTLFTGDIVGGQEDCIDINHCKNLHVVAGHLASGGTYVSTIKDSQDICVTYAGISDHGSVTDFDLGNWSDQGSNKTTGVVLQSFPDDVTTYVRVLNAERPTANGNFTVKRPWWSGFFLPVMRVLKALHLA